eukprot:Polyplicarium_translucidae@DN3060_c0_g1_i5.p1
MGWARVPSTHHLKCDPPPEGRALLRGKTLTNFLKVGMGWARVPSTHNLKCEEPSFRRSPTSCNGMAFCREQCRLTVSTGRALSQWRVANSRTERFQEVPRIMA